MSTEETKPTNQENLEKMQDEIRSVLGEIEYLRQQIGVIDTTITDLRTVSETLSYMKEKGEGRSIYIPLGAGVAIKGKIESVNDLVMDVGAGLLVSATIEEVKEDLDRRINALLSLRRALLKKIEEDSRKVNELIEKVRKLGGEGRA